LGKKPEVSLFMKAILSMHQDIPTNRINYSTLVISKLEVEFLLLADNFSINCGKFYHPRDILYFPHYNKEISIFENMLKNMLHVNGFKIPSSFL
jgi:hypothetical protein